MKRIILLAGFILCYAGLMAQGGKLVAQRAGKGGIIVHEVQSKQTLYALSRIYHLKPATIAEANKFDKGKSLSLGAKVNIPLTEENLVQKRGGTPVYYEVQEGENLQAVSNRFNKVPLKDLKTWNKLDGNTVAAGKEIVVGYLSADAGTANNTETNTEETPAKPVKAGKGQLVKITGTNINIRKGPGSDQEVIATAQQDDEVTVVKKVNNEWTAIRTKDGVDGYVASQFLQGGEKKAEPVKAEPKLVTATVSGTNINIRKGPGSDQAVIATAQQDEVVTVLKKVNNEWTAIRTKDGTEGYIASQFLGGGDKKAAPAKVEVVTAKVVGTNINIRKGPDTKQPVVAQGQQDEAVTVLKKVNDEWTAVRTADGTEGFVATQFLAFDGSPSAPLREPGIEKEKKEKIADVVTNIKEKVAKKEAEQPAEQPKVETAKPAPVQEKGAGYFRDAYVLQSNTAPVSEKRVVRSGIFKTDKGWDDNKYYLLMDGVLAGTIVKISNPKNDETVFAKVLGEISGTPDNKGLDIRISDAAAAALRVKDTEKFNVQVAY